MARSFEELIAWSKARLLTAEIYRLTRQGDFARDYGPARQIQRSAVSIMSNVAEGFERGHRGEFRQFLFIAKGSCAELRSQLYVAYDIGYLEDSCFRRLMDDAEEIARIIGGLCTALNRPRVSRDT